MTWAWILSFGVSQVLFAAGCPTDLAKLFPSEPTTLNRSTEFEYEVEDAKNPQFKIFAVWEEPHTVKFTIKTKAKDGTRSEVC